MSYEKIKNSVDSNHGINTFDGMWEKTEATAAFNNVVVDQTSITFNLEIIDEKQRNNWDNSCLSI